MNKAFEARLAESYKEGGLSFEDVHLIVACLYVAEEKWDDKATIDFGTLARDHLKRVLK